MPLVVSGLGEPPSPLISLEQARKFLNFDASDHSEDDELQEFLAGIDPVVEREVGPVVPRTVTVVTLLGRDGRGALPTANVLGIDSVVDAVQAGADVGPIEVDAGSFRAPALAGRRVRVTAQVGMDPIPQNIVYGALEILRLAWATQRRQSTRNGSTEQPQAPAFLISYRAAAWLDPHRQHLGFA